MYNILIACEESQRVCTEFRKRGFNAFSADVQEPSGLFPKWHILCKENTLSSLINGFCTFETMDGQNHTINSKWDMIIAFPPCTYLSNAGAARLYPKKGVLNEERYQKGLLGKEFFMMFYNADCEKICVENPIPSSVYALPPRTQIIEPFHFGEPIMKKTCLWLKGLSPLIPTNIVEPSIRWIGTGTGQKNRAIPQSKARDSKTRSKTFQGIAEAMAAQFGGQLEKQIDKQLSFFER